MVIIIYIWLSELWLIFEVESVSSSSYLLLIRGVVAHLVRRCINLPALLLPGDLIALPLYSLLAALDGQPLVVHSLVSTTCCCRHTHTQNYLLFVVVVGPLLLVNIQ